MYLQTRQQNGDMILYGPSDSYAKRVSMHTLLLATSNPHKLEEFRTLFSDMPLRLLSLHDVQLDVDVEETGDTFAENAELKGRTYAQMSHMLTLADDSGLEIDALGGVPGVHSARYLGRETSYEERFKVILEQLKGLPLELRSARFLCVIALAEPSGKIDLVEGIVEGVIADRPRGTNGFGYDPIFFLPELGKTFAELEPAVKNRISHRARAAQSARKLLENRPYDLSGNRDQPQIH
jgi:XTP/dITP diphosphohydrolase